MAHDSSFARLLSAWNARAGGSALQRATRGLSGLARNAFGARTDQNQVVWLGGRVARAPPAAVTSLSTSRRNYRIEVLAPADIGDVEQWLRPQHPRLLVVDVEWCERVGAEAVRRLHRRRPEIDWLLCWESPSPRWLDMLVQSGARGAVVRGADATALARAFDAVTAGEIWLSRQVMQWLYATIVEAPGNGPASTSPVSSWPADGEPTVRESELTPREAEVTALMRQGLTNRDIAVRLGVSINTVKKHLASAYEKHGLRSRRQARL